MVLGEESWEKVMHSPLKKTSWRAKQVYNMWQHPRYVRACCQSKH